MATVTSSIAEDRAKLLPPDEASQIVLDAYHRSRDSFVNPMRALWTEWGDLYRSYISIQDDSLLTQTFVPLIFLNVESFLPRLVANRPRVEVWGRGPEDAERAAMHRALLFYDWDLLNMVMFMIEFAKSAEIYGLAWAKVTHRREVYTRNIITTREVPRKTLGISMGTRTITGPQDVEITRWDDAYLELLEVDTVYPDPDGKCEDTCAYIIHKIQGQQLQDLKDALDKDGDPLYKPDVLARLVAMVSEGNRRETGTPTINQEQRSTMGEAALPSPDPHKREVTLLEYWTDEKVVTIVKEFPELPPIRNAFHSFRAKPFRRFTPIPLPNEIRGLAIPEILCYLNMEINTIHGARVDNLLQGVHKLVSIIRTSNLNPRNLRRRPGGHVFVDSHDDFKFIDPPRLDLSMYREEEQTRKWAQLAMATDLMVGMEESAGGGTATEAAGILQASGAKVGLMFQILSHQFLTPLGRDLIYINEGHISDERKIRIAGDDFQDGDFAEGSVQDGFLTVTPEKLRGPNELDLVLDVAATEPGTRQFKLQQGISALQALANFYPPDHPIMERMLAQVAQGFGIERPEGLIAEGREMIQRLREQEQSGSPGGGGATRSRAVAVGDQPGVTSGV